MFLVIYLRKSCPFNAIKAQRCGWRSGTRDRVHKHGAHWHFRRCLAKKLLWHLEHNPSSANISPVGAFMAYSLRRPLLSAVESAPFFSPSRRCFSQWPALRAGPQAPQPARPRQQVDRSIRVISKEIQAVPSDLGLLPSISPSIHYINQVPNSFHSDLRYRHWPQPPLAFPKKLPLHKTTPLLPTIPIETYRIPLP